MESSGSITVRVKSASLSCEDIVVECNLSHKVKQLKELIRLKSPMHPETGDQRLIYAGHLLDDEQILKDVLLGNGESVLAHASFTVHLATTLRGLGKSNQQQQQENSKKETSPSVSVPSGQQSSSSNLSSSSATPQSSFIRVESTPNVELPHFQSMRTGIPPDVLALHQYYVEQMMQYMMQWSQMTLGFAPPTPIFTAATNNISTSSYIPPPPPVRHPEEPANIIPQNIDVQENVRVNEVANRGGEEEEAPRDVLDWMYTVVRVALIFSVVYFYSNFTRFFLVVLFTALVMVFQRRQVAGQAEINAVEQRVEEDRANIPRAQDEIPNPQQVPTPASSEETTNNNAPQDQGSSTSETQSKHDTPVNETESAGNRSDTTGNSSETSNLLGTAGAETTLTETSEPRRSIRDITLTFLTTFFTSLIPEIPQNN